MFWFILRVLQFVIWYITFFMSKRMVQKVKDEGTYRQHYIFVETTERFKFPLWIVLIAFIAQIVPILGLAVTVGVTVWLSLAADEVFDEERPSFFLTKIFTKKI